VGVQNFFSLAPLANPVLYPPHLKIRGAAHVSSACFGFPIVGRCCPCWLNGFTTLISTKKRKFTRNPWLVQKSTEKKSTNWPATKKNPRRPAHWHELKSTELVIKSQNGNTVEIKRVRNTYAQISGHYYWISIPMVWYGILNVPPDF